MILPALILPRLVQRRSPGDRSPQQRRTAPPRQLLFASSLRDVAPMASNVQDDQAAVIRFQSSQDHVGRSGPSDCYRSSAFHLTGPSSQHRTNVAPRGERQRSAYPTLADSPTAALRGRFVAANSSLNPSPAPVACRSDGREPATDLPIAPRQQCAVRKIRPGQQQSQSPSGTGRVPNRRASSRERSVYRAPSNNDPL